MGMGSAPCSGYVLPATEENFKKLNISLGRFEKEYEDFKKSYPDDDFEGFLAELAAMYGPSEVILEAVPDQGLGAVITIELYRYDSDMGDRYDDLADGVYFVFYEDELYTKELTPVGEALKDKNLFPELQAWTMFG